MRYLFVKKCDCSLDEQKKSVRRLISLCFLLVLFCGALMCIPTEADASLYDRVIRFHVIANSDAEEDQALKLKVRDCVVNKYADKLSGYTSKEVAERELGSYLDEIEHYVNEVIKNEGYAYTCQVRLGSEFYNRTEYESFSMPSGNYTSLRIIIGEGAGKNWWCVLFPPFCTRAAIKETEKVEDEEVFIEAGFTSEQYKIITQTEKPKYRIKFRLLELLFG